MRARSAQVVRLAPGLNDRAQYEDHPKTTSHRLFHRHKAQETAIPDKIPTGRAMWITFVLMLASNLMASLTQSLMNIALDRAASDFHITLSMANWLVLGFTIVAATMITMAASILKRFGIRKVMLFGYIAAFLGSLLGLFAVNFEMMLGARLIQALTVGLFFPVITSVILTIAPMGKQALFLAINSGVIGVGLAFAPLLSGVILTYAGLRALFLVPIVLTIILMAFGHFILHDMYEREDRKIDALSVVLSFVGAAAFIYGLNEITKDALPSALIMAAGIAVLGIFAWRQNRLETPLLNLSPLRNKRFAIGEVLLMLGYMGSIFMSLLVPLYLEGTAGYSASIVGCVLCIPILCYAASCIISGRIEDKHGIWPVVPFGFMMLTVGFIGLGFTSSVMAVVLLLVFVACSYIGVGFLFPTLKASDLAALSQDVYSFGSSIHSVLVQAAGSVGSALFVGVMSADVARSVAEGTSKADAYASGFSHTILIALAIIATAFIGSVIYSIYLHRKRKQEGKI